MNVDGQWLSCLALGGGALLCCKTTAFTASPAFPIHRMSAPCTIPCGIQHRTRAAVSLRRPDCACAVAHWSPGTASNSQQRSNQAAGSSANSAGCQASAGGKSVCKAAGGLGWSGNAGWSDNSLMIRERQHTGTHSFGVSMPCIMQGCVWGGHALWDHNRSLGNGADMRRIGTSRTGSIIEVRWG